MLPLACGPTGSELALLAGLALLALLALGLPALVSMSRAVRQALTGQGPREAPLVPADLLLAGADALVLGTLALPLVLIGERTLEALPGQWAGSVVPTLYGGLLMALLGLRIQSPTAPQGPVIRPLIGRALRILGLYLALALPLGLAAGPSFLPACLALASGAALMGGLLGVVVGSRAGSPSPKMSAAISFAMDARRAPLHDAP